MPPSGQRRSFQRFDLYTYTLQVAKHPYGVNRLFEQCVLLCEIAVYK